MLKEKARLENIVNKYEDLNSKYQDDKEILDLLCSDIETEKQIHESLQDIHKQAQDFYIECLFTDSHDKENCFIDINSGAGGTESDDWSSMMLRMYLRFAQIMGFKAEVISISSGDEAGIKSASIKVTGNNAYGWLKTESGIHRLVRISPFNSAGKRMTSFSSAYIYPEINDDIDITIEDKDLKIDTYRSSGAGGQHVNTTDSAVRITHIPTNTVSQCQNNRSQHKNKAEAMQMLKSKLYKQELIKKQEQAQQSHSQKTDIGWGHQIRSYVLHPYRMVKDLRTGYNTSDVESVLDGDLKSFVNASLSNKI